MTDRRESGAFDERAALDQLERFREGIARERARRRAVSDEFESFVRSFKTPAAPDPAAPAPAPRPAPTPPVTAPAARRAAPVPARIDLPRASRLEVPTPPVLPVDPHAMFPTEIDPRVPAPPRRRRLALVMLAVLMLGVLAAWALWPTSPAVPAPEVTETGAPTPTPAETPPATGEAPPAPAGTPGPAPDSRVTELTTTRNVWVRVVADGERVLERELPAGSRIPITAQKSIVIRTGDAGAVSLTLEGEDQGPLGREGQVLTRTFTVPEK